MDAVEMRRCVKLRVVQSGHTAQKLLSRVLKLSYRVVIDVLVCFTHGPLRQLIRVATVGNDKSLGIDSVNHLVLGRSEVRARER